MSEIGVIHTEHINKYYIMGDVEVRALNDISLLPSSVSPVPENPP